MVILPHLGVLANLLSSSSPRRTETYVCQWLTWHVSWMTPIDMGGSRRVDRGQTPPVSASSSCLGSPPERGPNHQCILAYCLSRNEHARRSDVNGVPPQYPCNCAALRHVSAPPYQGGYVVFHVPSTCYP